MAIQTIQKISSFVIPQLDDDQVQACRSVLRLTSIAICHSLAPVWSLATTATADGWPIPPAIGYGEDEVVEFIQSLNTSNVKMLHPVLARDRRLATVFITLLCGKLLVAEQQGTMDIDYQRVVRELRLTDATASQRIPPRPLHDHASLEEQPWEFDFLSGGSVTSGRQGMQHTSVDFNRTRQRLLYILITSTLQYRYYPTNPALLRVLHLWASHYHWSSSPEHLRLLLLDGCSAQSYFLKVLKFIIEPHWNVVGEEALVENNRQLSCETAEDGGRIEVTSERLHLEADESQFKAFASIPVISRTVALFTIALLQAHRVTPGTPSDAGFAVVASICRASVSLLNSFTKPEDVVSNQERLLLLLGWILAWVPNLHVNAAVRAPLAQLFQTIQPFISWSGSVGATAFAVLRLLRRALSEPGTDPLLRDGLAHEVLHFRSHSARREVHLLVNANTRRVHRLSHFYLGRVSLALNPQAAKWKVAEGTKQTVKDSGSSVDTDKDILGYKANVLLNGLAALSGLDDAVLQRVQRKPKQCLAFYWPEFLRCCGIDASGQGKPDQAALQRLVTDEILSNDVFEMDEEEQSEYRRHVSMCDEGPRYDLMVKPGTGPLQRCSAPCLPVPDLRIAAPPFEPAEHLFKAKPSELNGMPETAWCNHIKSLWQLELERTPQGTELRLDIALVGGTVSLQRFLLGYCQLLSDSSFFPASAPGSPSASPKAAQPDDSAQPVPKPSQLRLFVLPFGSTNLVARWLALTDPTYYNMVYAPLSGPAGLEPDEINPEKVKTSSGVFSGILGKNGSKKGHNEVQLSASDIPAFVNLLNDKASPTTQPLNEVTEPQALLYRHCLHYYVQNGTPVQIRVFQVTGFTGKGEKMHQRFTLPFCQQIEVGLPCFATEYLIKHDHHHCRAIDGYTIGPEDLLNNPKWQKGPLLLSLTASHSGAFATTRDAVSWEGRAEMLAIRNVPKFGERGPIPDPTQPGLFVSVREADPKKYGLMALLAQECPDLRFVANFHAPEDELRVASSQEFRVLVDGDLLPAVTAIVVKPYLLPSHLPPTRSNSNLAGQSFVQQQRWQPSFADQQVTLPVMGLLPGPKAFP
eukprot:TRINITY_DN67725_c0_g1_i1.p1 TRINITY_DN67725_c0_g1~~TRINITY_DN67725_c0_g1_i1.p1  ORF type:complete len:1090 (+),score=145.75 TRINITY_DN67725_c0_g1_i1:63-3332(+)